MTAVKFITVLFLCLRFGSLDAQEMKEIPTNLGLKAYLVNYSSDQKIDELPSLKTTAWFCRLETNIEKKSNLASRFRLGSIDQSNYLEGKNNLILSNFRED